MVFGWETQICEYVQNRQNTTVITMQCANPRFSRHARIHWTKYDTFYFSFEGSKKQLTWRLTILPHEIFLIKERDTENDFLSGGKYLQLIIIIIIGIITELRHSKTILENTAEIEPQPVALVFKNLSQYSSRSK